MKRRRHRREPATRRTKAAARLGRSRCGEVSDQAFETCRRTDPTPRRTGISPSARCRIRPSRHVGELHMARLVGVDLPREKRIEVALTYIFGMGRTRAQETVAATGVSGDKRVRELTDEELVQLRDHIEENYRTEGDLRREVAADIRRKVEIGSYEGLRHRRGLPVHGQRTKTNARTRKGPKRTVAGKKKSR